MDEQKKKIGKNGNYTIAIAGGISALVLSGILSVPKYFFSDYYTRNSTGIAGFHAIHQVPISDNRNLVTSGSPNKLHTYSNTTNPESPNEMPKKNSERGIFIWLFINDRNKEIDEVRFRDLNSESIVKSGYVNSSDLVTFSNSQKHPFQLKDGNKTFEITDMTVCSDMVHMIVLERDAISGNYIRNAADEMEDNINDRDKKTFPLVYGGNFVLFENLNILTNMGLFLWCFCVALSVLIMFILMCLFISRISYIISKVRH